MTTEISQLAQVDMEALKQVLPIITPQDSTITGVDARSLHQALEIGNDFSTWMKVQVDRLELVENEDFEVFLKKQENPQGGRPKVDYIISLDAAKSIAMISQTEKGKVVRKYFIACEKVALAPRALTRLELIDLARESELARIDAERKVEELTPKATKFDTFMLTESTFTTTDVAKNLGTNAIKLNDFLRKIGWKFKDKSDRPTEYAIKNGFLVSKPVRATHDHTDGSPQFVHQTRITAAGNDELMSIFSNFIR